MEILEEPHAARILLTVRNRGLLRFSGIQEALGLNPNQVDRALKFLTRELFLVPEALPPSSERTRVLVQYILTRKGEAAAALLDKIRAEAHQNQRHLGSKFVRQIEALFDAA